MRSPMLRASRAAAALIALAAGTSAAAQHCKPTWDGPIGRPGISGIVRVLADYDGDGGRVLVAGGSFTLAGGQPAGNIAQWDGECWSSLEPRLEPGLDGDVEALAVYDDGTGPALYAGGLFTRAGIVDAASIARWDGQSWSGVGGGIEGRVLALQVVDLGDGPRLVAGGLFDRAGGVDAASVAAWDGATWSALGGGIGGGTPGAVEALAVFDDGDGPALYAAGDFLRAGGDPLPYIARWDGRRWSGLGEGLSGFRAAVYDLAVHDDGSGPALFAGGRFTMAGGVFTGSIARWDGDRWAAVGAGMNDAVRALASTPSGLIAAGQFSRIGGEAFVNIARWDGIAWRTLGEGVNGTVLAVHPGAGPPGRAEAYAGGDFTLAGSTSARSVARWGCPLPDCRADCDGDGLLLVFDFLCFQNLFDAMDPRADFDADGQFTLFDFLAFQNAFDAGCP
ncbi:MAG: GC-type dockerin domain-anchored protein [Phycisphaerales bacterium]